MNAAERRQYIDWTERRIIEQLGGALYMTLEDVKRTMGYKSRNSVTWRIEQAGIEKVDGKYCVRDIAKSKVLGWQPVRIVEPKKKRCG